MIIFPTIVYQTPGKHGQSYAWKAAPDQETFDALIASGWFETLPQARTGIVDDAPPTRDELERKATELGISFDGRSSDKKLAEKIAEALG